MRKPFFIKLMQDRNKRIMANTILQLTNFNKNLIKQTLVTDKNHFSDPISKLLLRDRIIFLFSSST